MEEEEKEAVLRETVEELRAPLCRGDVWYSDYVRLRCKAVKEREI